MNLSNFLTLIRIAVIPIIVFCIYLKNPYFGWVAFVLFCLASITDYFDGYIARLRNEVTNFGTFLDPIADKVLLLFLLFAIAISTQNNYIGLFAAIILAREFWVSALREYNSKKQNTAKTDVTFLAKAKTTFQFFAIALYLFGMAYQAQLVIFIGSFVFFIALLLSIKTGLNYTKATFFD